MEIGEGFGRGWFIVAIDYQDGVYCATLKNMFNKKLKGVSGTFKYSEQKSLTNEFLRERVELWILMFECSYRRDAND